MSDTTVDLNAICDRIRAAGMFAYVEYTGGGVATIYASADEDPTRPGLPNGTHPFTCDRHEFHDPGYQAIAGPGWFVGEAYATANPEGLPAGAYASLNDFYIGPDDQGDDAPYAATARDTEATLAARIITTIVDSAQREARLPRPDDACICGDTYREHAFDTAGRPMPLCHGMRGSLHCVCGGYVAAH